jgi:hypothetical protein
MAVEASITLNLGIVQFKVTQKELSSLHARFNRNPLYKGPCLILNRDTGLALDSGPNTKTGAHNVLWTPHGAPWQQWRFRSTGGGYVEILKEGTDLRLTAMAEPYDRGEVWLERKNEDEWSTRWRLKNTDDGAAFLIQNSSGHALDAGENASNGRDPHLWSSHWAPWQQWMVLRLPLS